MSVISMLRNLSEVWKLFSDMPDETTLNAELTALFLGISIKTLARYKQNGGGRLTFNINLKIAKR